MREANKCQRLAVIIPAYKVKRHILQVLGLIGCEVDRIYVIDDCSPEGCGKFVEDNVTDPRVRVVYHEQNTGVGGAVLTGYLNAINDGMDILIKVDGDGQMNPRLIPEFVEPIMSGRADYSKGNRFFDLEGLRAMPSHRIFGNAVLSFMTKISSGYWDIFDPTNGYTAIHSSAAKRLPFDKISKRYFFESDMLFRLNTIRAVVVDVPMYANYGDEVSNLKVSKIFKDFLAGNASNFFKRIFYNYYLRDMSVASVELPLGILLLVAGISLGIIGWIDSAANNVAASAGTVMLAALPIFMGIQLILAFISFDIGSIPRHPISSRMNYCSKKTSQNKGEL